VKSSVRAMVRDGRVAGGIWRLGRKVRFRGRGCGAERRFVAVFQVVWKATVVAVGEEFSWRVGRTAYGQQRPVLIGEAAGFRAERRGRDPAAWRSLLLGKAASKYGFFRELLPYLASGHLDLTMRGSALRQMTIIRAAEGNGRCFPRLGFTASAAVRARGVRAVVISW